MKNGSRRPRLKTSAPIHRVGMAMFCALAVFAAEAGSPIVDYDIAYVRQARLGDNANTLWPEIFHPARLEMGADLMLLHPDGSEEVLVDCQTCSVTDPYVSFDGAWIYYSLFYDLRPERLNSQRGDLPLDGADIFRIHVQNRQVEQLTFGEFTPNTGAGHWDETNPVDPPSEFNRLGYGILNLGPCPVPGGKIAFTSNRNGFDPPKGFTNPTLQLYVMDEDGSNITPIAPMSINSALHPTILKDGRLMFSSYESQGLRDRRLWGIWSIYPDGREWAPVVSAFRAPQAFHFMTQLSGEDLITVDYYNLNNNGFGALYRFPVRPPSGTPPFHSAFLEDNPFIDQTVGQGFPFPFRMPFTPWGMYSITPFTHGSDEAAPIGTDGQTRVGKFTHPSAAPAGDLLAVWTPGPANDLNRPTPLPYYDGGLYLVPGGDVVNGPGDLVELKNDPAYNEAWPRAVVPYNAIHGVVEPTEIPWLPNDGSLHPELPPGTPFGLVGSSSLYKRESLPHSGSPEYDGLDVFNTSQNGQSSNWGSQGSDAGKYANSDIWAVRVVALEPNTHRSYGPNLGSHFFNHANERHRILGEVPVRKFDAQGDPILDAEGNPDTSFLVKLPADTPFTFQTLDRNGMVLNMAQTWHQVRPGEVRTNCGGCHAHSQEPLEFSSTAAGQSDFPVTDLSTVTPLISHDSSGQPILDTQPVGVVDVEFLSHIRPILQAKCIACHTSSAPTPPGNLVLDDLTLYGGLPGDYKRLADDQDADWGYPPVITFGPVWRQTNASRYIRKFQSRRSMLIWKLFGQRLDGWTNADHPTESVPGDPSTLPAGANRNLADLDYTGSVMPPPGNSEGIPPLTTEEKFLFARWIDLGCPIDTGTGDNRPFGWYLDDLKPTLSVSAPRPGFNESGVTEILFGAADANSGLDLESFSLTSDFSVAGRSPGAELFDLAQPQAPGVWSIPLAQPLPALTAARLFAQVADSQGNITRIDLSFSTLDPAVFSDGFETGDLSQWTTSVGGS
ncbi:MAG: hypothetical protein K0U98_10690 [Deltaproteobacteria bacterium]|nr:hypothetical protein [Deltaproteobacteria bacterium]